MGLKKVWKNSIGDDFDLIDFEELSKKFGFTPLNVLNYDPCSFSFKITKESLNNNCSQLALVFDNEEVA